MRVLSLAKRPRPRRAAKSATPPKPEVTPVAYRRLRDLIVSGRLAPGAPLIETDLSKRLGVSRTPVRAALQRLQQEGFVVSSPAGLMQRAIVAPLTADDMREVFQMVGALEAAAARLSAELPEEARGPLAADLSSLNEAMRTAILAEPPDLLAAQDAHARFHKRYVDAAAGPRLKSELDVLQPQAERYERVYTSAVVHAFEDTLREHDSVIEALRAGDGDAAEAAVARNWRGSADRYHRVVTLLGERGNW